MSSQASSTNDTRPLRADPWQAAWAILSSDRLLAAALIALALLLAIAALLPQAPDSSADPIAYSRWRGGAQAWLGNWFEPAQAAGLVSIERSPAMRVVAALVALCLLLRLVDSAWSAWCTTRGRGCAAQGNRTNVAVSLDQVEAALRKKRFHVVREGDALRACRHRWASLARVAVYGGALLLIAGITLSSAASWHSGDLTLAVGQAAPVGGQGQPTSLRLDELTSSGAGRLALVRETDTLAETTVTPHRPAWLGNAVVFVRGTGPAIRASATFTDGRPARLQAAAMASPSPELLLLLTSVEPDRYAAVPEAGLVVRLSRGGGHPPAINVQVIRTRTGATIYSGSLPPEGQVQVEGVEFRFQAENYVVLNAVRDPGPPVALAGMMLLGLGLVAASLWRPAVLEAQAALLTAEAPSTAGALPTAQGTSIRGDVDQIHPLMAAEPPDAAPPGLAAARYSAGARILDAACAIALAVVSIAAALAVGRSLWSAGSLWPNWAVGLGLVAIWLAGCAGALLHRATRWGAALCVAMLGAAVATTIAAWPNLFDWVLAFAGGSR